MRNRARGLVTISAVLAVALASAFTAGAVASTKPKTAKDSGTSYVSIVHQQGKVLYAAGYSFDKRFGQVAVTYVTTVTPGKTGTVNVVAKRVTLYTATGTLYGTATAVQNIATGAVTLGKLSLTHGTGALEGHSFTGALAGSYNSKSGVYTFHYAGVLK